jgi:biotin operon repressor
MSYIGLAVVIENVRALNADPVLTLQYANFMPVPPASVRMPVSLRRLARVLEMPLETVRRYVQQLELMGFVARTGNGYIVPGETLVSYDMAIAQAVAVARLGAEVTQLLSSLDSRS